MALMPSNLGDAQMGRIKGSKVVNGKVIPPSVGVISDPLAKLDQEIHALEMQIERLRMAKDTISKLWASNT